MTYRQSYLFASILFWIAIAYLLVHYLGSLFGVLAYLLLLITIGTIYNRCHGAKL